MRQVGGRVVAGLFTEARYEYRPFCLPRVSIRGRVRNYAYAPTIAEIHTTTDKFHEPATVIALDATDTATLSALFNNYSPDVTSMNHSTKSKKSEEVLNAFIDPARRSVNQLSPVEQIPAGTSTILRVEFSANKDDIIIIPWRHIFNDAAKTLLL
ncbi:hypothetical protein HRG_012933 [Hirsutella rhossiliensis]